MHLSGTVLLPPWRIKIIEDGQMMTMIDNDDDGDDGGGGGGS
jgi:hypothetical protein